MTKISILIADDHGLIKDAIAMVLTQSGEFLVSTTDSFSDTEAVLTQNDSIDVRAIAFGVILLTTH